MLKIKKIVATVCTLAMAITSVMSFSAVVANAAYDVPTGVVKVSYPDKTTTAGSKVLLTVSLDGFDTYVGRYVDSYKVNLAATNASTYFDLANAVCDVDSGLAATLSEAIMVNTGKYNASKDQIQFSFTPSGNAGKFAFQNGLIGTIELTLTKDLDTTIDFGFAGTYVTTRSAVGSGDYVYIGTEDVGNVKNNVSGTTANKLGVVMSADVDTIKPQSDPDPWTDVAPGTDYTGEYDKTKAAAYTVELAGDGNTYNAITWKATKDGVTKGHVTALGQDLGGEGSFKFGIAIGGVETSELSGVQAAWGNQTPSAE